MVQLALSELGGPSVPDVFHLLYALNQLIGSAIASSLRSIPSSRCSTSILELPNLAPMELFGCVTIASGKPDSGKGWRIKQIKKLSWGITLFEGNSPLPGIDGEWAIAKTQCNSVTLLPPQRMMTRDTFYKFL